MNTVEVPLFPLRTVLFPGGTLPLRIFEQRYLSMIRECARNDSEFGVCLIMEEQESVAPVIPARIGTMARITDWFTLDSGLLGLTTAGTVRYATESTRKQKDGLYIGQVCYLNEPAGCQVPESHAVLSSLLARFMDKVGQRYPEYTPGHLQDALWVGYRLSELLPLATIEQQHLLEMGDPLERLQKLLEIMPRFQSA